MTSTTSKGTSRVAVSPSGSNPRKSQWLIPWHRFQLPVVIPRVDIPFLEVPTVVVVALGSDVSSSEGLATILYTLSFDPSQFVKNEDFERFEAMTEEFME